MNLETSDELANFYGSQQVLLDELLSPEEVTERINAVTREDIIRVAKKYLDPDRMVIVVLGNQEKIKLKY